MKLFRILIILFVCIGSMQCYAQCDRQVSTDPTAPTNTALPDFYTPSGPPYAQDTRYLNGLDWWSPNSYTLTSMWYNPGQPYTAMSNIQSPNTGSDYSYLNPVYGAEKLTPENGWELLLVNLGRYPDNVTVHNNIDLKAVPYIVLYNKYRGIIRVFVQYGYNPVPNDAIDGVKINLEYNATSSSPNNLSGLFRLGEGIDQALDQTTDVKILSAIAPPNGQFNFWLSGDFQVHYDPCVCNYPTNIKLDFEFFSTTQLELYGRGITTQENVIDANGNLANADYLSGIDFTSELDAENGYIMYKKLGTLMDDYIDDVQLYNDSLISVGQHNDEVERKLVIVKAVKSIVVSGLDGSLNTLTAMPWFTKLEEHAADLIGKDSVDIKALIDKGEEYIGKKLDTYISENWKLQKEPTRPSMPTASFSEMRMSGELENRLTINGPVFSTPGSFVNEDENILNEPSSSPHSYPIYNNPLGVFALLETPKVNELLGSKKSQTCEPFVVDGVGTLYDIEKKVINGSQYQLTAPIKYALNPALDIQDHSVEFSMEVTQSNKAFLPVFGNFPGTVLSSTNVINEVSNNVTSDQINTYQNDVVYDAGVQDVDAIAYTTPFVDIAAYDYMVAHISQEVNTAYRTSDNTCAGTSNFYFPLPYHQEFEWKDVKVRIKLRVKVNYKSSNAYGEPHAYTYNFTYDIDPNDITASGNFDFSFANSTNHFGGNPQDVTFTDTHFDGSSVEGCKLYGNVYYCDCWNDMTINGDITVANGYEVNMRAGSEIEVINNSNLAPECVLEIRPIIEYSNPTDPASDDYVRNFCKGLNPNSEPYQANVPTKSIGDENEDGTLETESDQPLEKLTFQLFPNPTTDVVWLGYSKQNEEKISFTITDLSGKIVQNIEEGELAGAGSHKIAIATKNLAKGFYVCTLRIGKQSKSKQLIVQ